MSSKAPPLPHTGIRFACQCSGRCCRFRDGYDRVYVSLEERRRIAAHLGMRTSTFTRTWCDLSDGDARLRAHGDACVFLRDGLCSVYEARPLQCRTWPFWPENMEPRTWREVASFCPGVGKGPVIPGEEIRGVLRKQRAADENGR